MKDPCKEFDKRTKAYKDCKKTNDYKAFQLGFKETKGAGDVIAQITKATGIDKVVKFIAGEDCGCDERKEKLNASISWKVYNCPTQKEYEWAKEFLARNSNKATGNERRALQAILNRVHNKRLTQTRCGSCFKSQVDKLKELIKGYE